MKKITLLLCLACCLFMLNIACSEYSQLLCEKGKRETCSCSNGKQGTKTCSNDSLVWSHCQCPQQTSEKTLQQENQVTPEPPTTKESTKAQESPTTKEKVDNETSPEKKKEKFAEEDPSDFVETIESTQKDGGQPSQPDEDETSFEVPTIFETSCQEGKTMPCFSGRKGCVAQDDGSFQCKGACKTGLRTCKNGSWSTCQGEVLPTVETRNNIDDNCDGKVDNVFVQIDSSGSFSCGLLSDATVKCWGSNYYGQIGADSKKDTILVPTKINNLGNVKQISTGSDHICALLTNGSIRCWGNNIHGQLGNGTNKLSVIPTMVLGISNAKQVSSGDGFSCALLQNETVMCWGNNYYGQLGNGTNKSQVRPVLVHNLGGVKQVSAGKMHACVTMADNSVKCWGHNRYGQLGNNTTSNSNIPSAIKSTSKMTATKHISSGESYTCSIQHDNSVYCWGNNDRGQLGTNVKQISLYPRVVMISNVKQIAAGKGHTCAVSHSGKLLCWGSNKYGQLVNGTNIDSQYPGSSSLTDVKQVSVGGGTTCVLFNNGGFKCYGASSLGQLGNGTGYDESLPKKVDGLQHAIQVSTGEYHTCALLKNQTVQCWGTNTSGQLADPKLSQSHKPVLIKYLSKVRQISAGGFHNCALLANGTVKCWGRNEYGQVGTIKKQNIEATPVLVAGLNNVIFISSGTSHTCALLNDGTVKCWGENGVHQLGNGRTTNSSMPVTVKGLTDVVQLSAGLEHNCALLKNGTAKCWGFNQFGQLGNGKNTGISLTSVKNLKQIKQIVAGAVHTCALLLDGSTWCWGANGNGELGIQGIRSSSLPRKTDAPDKIQQIFVGIQRTCVLFSIHGKLSCWGRNDSGQLGDGTFEGKKSYAKASYFAHVRSISINSKHTCALFIDGSISCSGDNRAGQLGYK